MNTLANQFGDYRCSSESSVIDTAVLIMYASAIVAYLLLTLFGDCLTRKKFMIIGQLATILGLVVAIFSVNILMGAFGMFLSCLGAEWIYTISLIFIS